MDKDRILDDIFDNDPLGLLNVKPKNSTAKTAEERLISSFLEINDFIRSNDREPEASTNVAEFMLYTRLKSLREENGKIEILSTVDIYHLLPKAEADKVNEPGESHYKKPKEINSIDDIFGDDHFDILGKDEEGLFNFKHTPQDYDRASADFIARRKPCKDFEKYKALLKQVQDDLANGKRKLINFNQGNLKEGAFYVHNGLLFLLEKINISQKDHYKPDGTRVREDGRTRCIFENGTQSNMLKRSVEKILYTNGLVVTDNLEKVNEGFLKSFGTITTDDQETGYIYVLKSKSFNPEISSIKNLYKIGYSRTEVTDRIKNAEKEPTYLMAPVEYIAGWKCYNMNAQKFEQLMHNFFGKSCLEIDVFDEKGKRHTPREWFIAPLDVIEQAISLIIGGQIVNYRYDPERHIIAKR
jgi:hypothetical protein